MSAVGMEPGDLGNALLSWRGDIVEEWEARVRRNPRLAALPEDALRDHVPILLTRLGESLGRDERSEALATAVPAEQHALLRLAQSIELSDFLSELSALRQVILDRWIRERHGVCPETEILALDHAIDAVAAEAAVSYSEARERALRALDAMATSAMEMLPLEATLHRLMSEIAAAVGTVDAAGIFLVEHDRLVLRAILGARELELGHFSLAIGEGFAGKVAATRQPAFTAQASTDPSVKSAALLALGIRALYGVPLISRGELLGVVTMGSSTDFGFTALAQQLMRALADRAAVVIGFDQLTQARERLARENRVQRARLDAIIAAAPMGIALLEGADLRVTLENQVFRGMTPEPFRTLGAEGHPLRDLLAPEFRESVLATFERIRVTSESHAQREFEYSTAERGKTYWDGWVIPISGDASPEYLIIVSDVTRHVLERRRAQASERRLKTILETMPAGVFVSDATGAQFEANEEARRIWGGQSPLARSVDEIGSYQAWWPDSGKPVSPDEWASLRALRTGETILGQTIDILRFDGTRGTILNNAAPLRDDTGAIDGVVVALLDISESRRLAVELEAHSAQLDAILKAIADGLVVYGPDTRIIGLNDRAKQLLGYMSGDETRSLPERLANHHFVWADGHPITEQDHPAARALRGELVRNETMCAVAPDGRWTWINTSAAPIRIPSGRITGAVSTLVDVTALNERRRQAEDFVRMLSHDLRTPLGTISVQAHMLARGPLDAESVARRTEAISRSTQRMTSMIRDLVDLAHLEIGGLSAEVTPLDLPLFLRELLDRLRGTLDVSRVRTLFEADLPRTLADPPRLERIIVNLLSNALKYSAASTEVLLEARATGEQTMISVQDFGHGIPADELPHVFERYFRSRNVAEHVEGLGLGLYITRLLAEAQGGRVSVESEPGRGSRFIVRLPAAPAAG